MKTLPEMFTIVAKQNASRTAIVDVERAVSYAVLEKRITSLAVKLYDMGIRRGDPVAILLPNGLDLVRSYFAIVTLGAIVVPLNDHYQENELLYFLEECGLSLLITSLDFFELSHRVIWVRQFPCKLFVV